MRAALPPAFSIFGTEAGMLELKGLTKTYRTGDKALAEVSFTVPKGQVVG
jgi:ABC-type multidrug transport system ATPase subunit